ncbi:MAG TPA: thiamine pyrophosphate-binding protein [Galbitalea sp.]|nr:thiamine pyrophosphate-binding protein [Galbitalea sp.]
MSDTTGGHALVEALRAEGVKDVFGVVGTAMLNAYDALHSTPEIRYVGVRHEQNGVHMADAYARIARRPGVMLAAQPGPGTTNLVSGVAEAFLAYSPVVVIAGDTTLAHVDRGTFQEIDQQSLFAPITKRTLTVHSADRISEYVHDAFRIANTGRKGPVVLNVPGDLLTSALEVSPEDPTRYFPIPATAPRSEDVAAITAEIKNAQRPVIIAGAGVKWSGASTQLVELAHRIGAPIVASGGNGDVAPNDDPLFVGQMGPRGNSVADAIVAEADLILAIGTRLGYNTTLFDAARIPRTAVLVHSDIEPSAIGRHYPAKVGVASDARELLRAILKDCPPSGESHAEWVGRARERRESLIQERAAAALSPQKPLHPINVFAALQRVLPRDAIVTIDTGTISTPATDGIMTFEPPSLLAPLDFGLVGFSYPAGLGAKVAAPSRPVVSIVGDGAFSMSMIELATAEQAGLPTVTLVLNNNSWGAEKAYQRDFFGGRYFGSDLINPDFVKVAEAYGVRGVHATTTDEVSEAVAHGIADGVSVVVDIEIDQASITSLRKDYFTR